MVESEVFEVGLFTEGIPIIRRQYFKSEDMFVNPILIGEFLSPIQSYDLHDVNTVIPQLFQIEDMFVLLKRFSCFKGTFHFLLYVICQAGTESIRNALNDLVTELTSFDNILINYNLDTESLKNLYPVFDEKFLPFTS